ncbi:MAG: hypothetical protein CXT73_07230 [Methanobacteriota archaeon]|nr:MAG: hypothetical protein CXT73_07230 [Euryarchaeota archaeon]
MSKQNMDKEKILSKLKTLHVRLNTNKESRPVVKNIRGINANPYKEHREWLEFKSMVPVKN